MLDVLHSFPIRGLTYSAADWFNMDRTLLEPLWLTGLMPGIKPRPQEQVLIKVVNWVGNYVWSCCMQGPTYARCVFYLRYMCSLHE